MRGLDLKSILLPALSGLLGFASLPALGQGYLAWFAQVPLLLFLLRRPSGGRAFLGGVVAGFVQFACLLSWIPPVLVNYGGVPALVAWVLFALLMIAIALYPGFACGLTGACMQRAGKGLLFLFPFAWVTAEVLLSFTLFGGFPWMLAGYSQTRNLALIQIADITGVYGVSFVVLCVNAGIVWLFHGGVRKPKRLLPVLGALGLVTACVSYGFRSLQRWDGASPRYTAALLQGNISADDPDDLMRRKFEGDYLAMAARIKSSRVDLLVLPESPAPKSYQLDEEYRQRLQELARHYSLGIVFSNVAFAEAPGDSRYFNSAYFLDQDGRMRGRYDKIHLVPFGEYVPMKSVFFFLESITREVSDFSPGREYVQVETPAGRMSAIICFEAVFPGLVRKFVARGSKLIVNLTNDAWYGDSAAPHQHLEMARWRAIENRRYILRAANSGISAIIDPAGRVCASTGLMKQDTCLGRFDFVSYRSLYTRAGDVFAALCAIISFLLLTYSLAKGGRSGARSGRAEQREGAGWQWARW